jgi:hypothetical protein
MQPLLQHVLHMVSVQIIGFVKSKMGSWRKSRQASEAWYAAKLSGLKIGLRR